MQRFLPKRGLWGVSKFVWSISKNYSFFAESGQNKMKTFDTNVQKSRTSMSDLQGKVSFGHIINHRSRCNLSGGYKHFCLGGDKTHGRGVDFRAFSLVKPPAGLNLYLSFCVSLSLSLSLSLSSCKCLGGDVLTRCMV